MTSVASEVSRVVGELLSNTGEPGMPANVLVPALCDDLSAISSRVRPLFKHVQVGERAADTVAIAAEDRQTELDSTGQAVSR